MASMGIPAAWRPGEFASPAAAASAAGRPDVHYGVPVPVQMAPPPQQQQQQPASGPVNTMSAYSDAAATPSSKDMQSPAASSVRTYYNNSNNSYAAVSPESLLSLAPSPAGTFEVVSPAPSPWTPAAAATPAAANAILNSLGGVVGAGLGGTGIGATTPPATNSPGTVELWLFPLPSSPQPPPHSLAGFQDLETGTLSTSTPTDSPPWLLFKDALSRALARPPVRRLGSSCYLLPAPNRYGIEPEWDAWQADFGLHGGVWIHVKPMGTRFRGLTLADLASLSSNNGTVVSIVPTATSGRLESDALQPSHLSPEAESELLENFGRTHGTLPTTVLNLPKTILVTLPHGKIRVPTSALVILVPNLPDPRTLLFSADPLSTRPLLSDPLVWFKPVRPNGMNEVDLARVQRKFVKTAPPGNDKERAKKSGGKLLGVGAASPGPGSPLLGLGLLAQPKPMPNSISANPLKRTRTPDSNQPLKRAPQVAKSNSRNDVDADLRLEMVGDDVFDMFFEKPKAVPVQAQVPIVPPEPEPVVEQPLDSEPLELLQPSPEPTREPTPQPVPKPTRSYSPLPLPTNLLVRPYTGRLVYNGTSGLVSSERLLKRLPPPEPVLVDKVLEYRWMVEARVIVEDAKDEREVRGIERQNEGREVLDVESLVGPDGVTGRRLLGPATRDTERPINGVPEIVVDGDPGTMARSLGLAVEQLCFAPEMVSELYSCKGGDKDEEEGKVDVGVLEVGSGVWAASVAGLGGVGMNLGAFVESDGSRREKTTSRIVRRSKNKKDTPLSRLEPPVCLPPLPFSGGPFSGRKDIGWACVFPEGCDVAVLDSLGDVWESLGYGRHEKFRMLGVGLANGEDAMGGLVRVDEIAFAKDDAFPRGFRGEPGRHLVIYLLDPFGTPRGLANICKAFVDTVLEPLGKLFSAPLDEVSSKVVLHVLPCALFANPGTWTRNVVHSVARSTYDRCRVAIWRNPAWKDRGVDYSDRTNFYAAFAPAVVLGGRPRVPMFQSLITTARRQVPKNALEPDRVVHLGYAWLPNGKTAGVLLDSFGEMLETFVVSSAGAGDRVGVLRRLWSEVLGRFGVRAGFCWRVVVAKVGILGADEVNEWNDIFASCVKAWEDDALAAWNPVQILDESPLSQASKDAVEQTNTLNVFRSINSLTVVSVDPRSALRVFPMLAKELPAPFAEIKAPASTPFEATTHPNTPPSGLDYEETPPATPYYRSSTAAVATSYGLTTTGPSTTSGLGNVVSELLPEDGQGEPEQMHSLFIQGHQVPDSATRASSLANGWLVRVPAPELELAGDTVKEVRLDLYLHANNPNVDSTSTCFASWLPQMPPAPPTGAGTAVGGGQTTPTLQIAATPVCNHQTILRDIIRQYNSLRYLDGRNSTALSSSSMGILLPPHLKAVTKLDSWLSEI